MKPTKLKTSREIDISSILINFVSKNYGPQSVTQNLINYFSDFNQNRFVISHNTEELDSIKDISMAIQMTTKYFNQLIAIKSKMVFGSQHQGCNINFTWTDTITGNLWGSTNINFEYYNVLFNLASLYFQLGYQKSMSPKIDKFLRKEAIKDYKYSLYLFNIVRDEAIYKIEKLELPYDLYPTYCDYFATLCIIYGQIEIVKIAEETSPNEYALRGKLLMGISENYNKAYLLSTADPTNKGGKDSFRNYLSNRCFYYKSLVYKKLSEIKLKNFEETGLGYGEALVYQQLAIQQLTECQKTINFCEGLVEVDKFNDLFNNEKKIEAKLADLNYRIYHQFTPDPKTIKLETKVLMVPLSIDNLYIAENQLKFREDKIIYCEDLDLLTPNEIKPLLDKYKNQMTNFIEQYITKYENEASIKQYIDKLNLPNKLIIKPTNSKNPNSFEIPPELWEKISKIQKLGGGFYLTNSMNKILNKSNELIEKLNSILSNIMQEEKEDDYYRKKIGEQWVINPSNSLNINYIQAVKNYLTQINKGREYDKKENYQINENVKNYDDLSLTKSQIEQKFIQSGQGKDLLTPEEQKIRDEIIKLYILGDKSYDIVNPILNEIKSGAAVINYFSEVVNHRMTEKSVFDLTKEKYLKKLQSLEGISNEIKIQMKTINDLIPKINQNDYFPMENNSKENQLFDKLEKLADDFMEKVEKILKGENYYIEFEKKINSLINQINGWIEKRKEERKMLLGNIKGNIPKYNPNKIDNPFENINNNDYFNSNNKSDYYKPNPNFNNYIQNNPQIPRQEFNQNMNHNQIPNQNVVPSSNYNNFPGQNINNGNKDYSTSYSSSGTNNNNPRIIPPSNFTQNITTNYNNVNKDNNQIVIPPSFNQNNIQNIDDHFNPNQPQNMNNFNKNMNSPFSQNNYNYQNYNNTTPYNKGGY